ncbi:MAG: Veg family protein [Tissierellia bacterium]|nr:Veg family protein [Tissierellia bacterium]
MKKSEALAAIRSEVEENIGKKVLLKADKGRKRIITREGFIENAFPSLFTVRVNNDFDDSRTVSYTYSDVLTSTVKIKIVS